MAKFERRIKGNFDSIVSRLDADIMGHGLSMELVDQSDYRAGDTRVAVRVYDKYFMRNESRASLSLTVVDGGHEIFISAIGAGGGTGAIFNLNWGAEDSLTDIVENSLADMGL